MRLTVAAADEATVRFLDALVIFWLVLWIFIGASSAVTIWRAADVGDTITNAAHALDAAGTALTKVSAVPIIGGDAGALGSDVSTTAADVAERGQQVKGQFRQLSVMLGFSIMAMPTTPVVGLYLPLRLARRRERADIRRALREGPHDPLLDQHLAERAERHLSFAAVRALRAAASPGSSHDLDRELADAELARLGLQRPRG